MAGRILHFRLGSGDDIDLEDLRFALQKIAGVLSDLDAAAAKHPRGAVRWRVSVLQKESPPLLGVTAEPVPRKDPQTRETVRRDTSRQVEDALLSGVRLLDGGERPKGISDAVIDKIRHLAVRSRRIGDIEVYSDAGRSEISEATLFGIDKVIGSAARSKGSILGKLDTIAVHYGNEIRVWDENSDRAVRCRYPDSLEDDVKDNLPKACSCRRDGGVQCAWTGRLCAGRDANAVRIRRHVAQYRRSVWASQEAYRRDLHACRVHGALKG